MARFRRLDHRGLPLERLGMTHAAPSDLEQQRFDGVRPQRLKNLLGTLE